MQQPNNSSSASVSALNTRPAPAILRKTGTSSLAHTVGRHLQGTIGSTISEQMNSHPKNQTLNMLALGGSGDGSYPAATTNPTAPFTMIMENPAIDPIDEDSDSESENSSRNKLQSQNGQLEQEQQVNPNGLKPGKKTKGRVKIKMEFIENKLRRYTTFSKRKTGIMKKAYELSTLTGTQVMLLVASETGHVYTFATRKLQPMITSESGKNLIQTCLNSPENGVVSLDQRMNPTGFEEMELSYAVGDEDPKSQTSEDKSLYSSQSSAYEANSSDSTSKATFYSQSVFPTPTSYIPAVTNQESADRHTPNHMDPSNNYVTPKLETQNQPVALQNQTIYSLTAAPSAPLLSLPGSASASLQQAAELVQVTLPPTSTTTNNSSFAVSNSQTLMTPSIVMYQTPQGLMYATPGSAALPSGSIFNFQQPAQALSNPEPVHQGTQYITIPVPVSLAGSSQLVQIAGNLENAITLDPQPPPSKKDKK